MEHVPKVIRILLYKSIIDSECTREVLVPLRIHFGNQQLDLHRASSFSTTSFCLQHI